MIEEEIHGIKVPGTLVPGTPSGVVTDSKYVKGTYIVVQSFKETELIPRGAREEGTLVYISNEDEEYRIHHGGFVKLAKRLPMSPIDNHIYALQDGRWVRIDGHLFPTFEDLHKEFDNYYTKKEVDRIVDELKEYDSRLRDDLIVKILAESLQNKAYTDSKIQELSSTLIDEISTSLKEGKSYTDEQVTNLNNQLLDLMQQQAVEGKDYIDYQISEVKTLLESEIAKDQEYVDSKMEEAVADSKVYVDEELEKVKTSLVQMIIEGDELCSYKIESVLKESKAYTDEEIEKALSDLVPFDIKVVDELPEVGEKGIIYLLKHEHSEDDIYDEYIWTGEGYEKIGNTDIDLKDYATLEELSSSIEDAIKEANEYTDKKIEESGLAPNYELDKNEEESTIILKSNGALVSQVKLGSAAFTDKSLLATIEDLNKVQETIESTYIKRSEGISTDLLTQGDNEIVLVCGDATTL